MAKNDRENLLRMVRGSKQKQSRVYFLRFGDEGRDPFSFDEEESDELFPDSETEFGFMFGTRPEMREQVLRENRCLVRQENGSFRTQNTDREGPTFLVI